MLAKSSEAQQWTVSELTTMLQLFKLPSDPTMTVRKQYTMQQYEQTKLRTLIHHEGPTYNADITTQPEMTHEPEPAEIIHVGIKTMVNGNIEEVMMLCK
jgi:hypothetical protein